MDKHERKRIAKWEMQKAKRQEKFEAEIRMQRHEEDFAKVTDFAHSYRPDMTDSLSDLILLANDARIGTVFDYTSSWHSYGWFWTIKYKETTLERIIDMEKTFESIRLWKYANEVTMLFPEFRRTIQRTALFKEELEFKARKYHAILNCKMFKEELMMVTWHPRRMKYIADTYGWGAWENLLG